MRFAPSSCMATDHRNLSAFTLADELVLRIYRITRTLPVWETYGLRSQMRRAAVSIPTNIVEGAARDSDREHDRYYEIAFASTRELVYLLELCGKLELIELKSADELRDFAGRVAAALAALRKSLSHRKT
ncbi:MAG TPA: four helix bundle protein [Vicinamibacterales bacterium]|nr:four helix bundle protein [Vicinamibacterales bacterium]